MEMGDESKKKAKANYELIKNFKRTRKYLREFYVDGSKRRDEYTGKSARSYDNERRRIDNWLDDKYMPQRYDQGKRVSITMDTRLIQHNPLYNAFKAKSFTDNDIMLHFYILDMLTNGKRMSLADILGEIDDQYLSILEDCKVEKVENERDRKYFKAVLEKRESIKFEPNTVRKKLSEYVKLGLLGCDKEGKENVYYRLDSDKPSIKEWKDAIDFYSEEEPLGVIGSFLLDRQSDKTSNYYFKHHYIFNTFDCEEMSQILQAIDEQRDISLDIYKEKWENKRVYNVCPLKIYISTQTGRQHLAAYDYTDGKVIFFRLDSIISVTLEDKTEDRDWYESYFETFSKNLWGVATGDGINLEHLEMTVLASKDEDYIVNRLNREKRNGKVEQIDRNHWKFTADVFDAGEMVPWIRTFIGRITDLSSSNPKIVSIINDDIYKLLEMYGGRDDTK